ncbi:preprotein translocase subunit SecE [Slackia exigua]|uniref:preprotein translocase subunit SecE n=1 Tax=Slackia exigua TaxID=84109 RepID=UPI003BA1F180
MANKSKTQKAKASAARQARKAARDNAPEVVEAPAADQAAPSKLKGLFIKSEEPKEETKKAEKAEKASAKPKKQRFKFLKDVRLELKRVTWPTRQEVIRWTGVVLGALVFFGVFVAVLDAVIQPIVVAISGLGA